MYTHKCFQGALFPQIMPHTYVHLASVILFFAFGLYSLREAYKMDDDDDENEELEEAETVTTIFLLKFLFLLFLHVNL